MEDDTLEPEKTLYAFAKNYLQTLCSDLTDEDLAELRDSTGKTPGWILGHIRVVGELGVQLLGGQPGCESSWFAAFGPGSVPSQPNGESPDNLPSFSVEEIVKAIDGTYAKLLEMFEAAPAADLDEPHSFEPLAKTLPRKRDLLTHLLTTHLAYHLAQLSACRRSKGLGSLF